MKISTSTREINVGVVGLGLMGTSIAAALLGAGHRVKAIAPRPVDLSVGPRRIQDHLVHCLKAGLLEEQVEDYMRRVVVSEDYSHLTNCQLVLECVVEDADIKRTVYRKITDVVTVDTVIASNTSAIPISELQKGVRCPERFLGIHWAEPAYMTRFLEITCGDKTSVKYAAWAFNLAHAWGKEPTLLRRDIRGFVTNRLMYAIYREMFSMIEKGEASAEDVDKAFRYDAGSWMTLMGVFRRMDYAGVRDFYSSLRNIFPTLCNDDGVPHTMKDIVRRRLRGTQDGEGLYTYSAEIAQAWDEAFAHFNKDIYELASRYPSGTVTTAELPDIKRNQNVK